MIPTKADTIFDKGKAALDLGRTEEAVVLFRSALRMAQENAANQRHLRYLSYFGLSSAMAGRPTREAIRACEVAAEQDFLSAEMQLNLGKVYLLAGKTTRALATFERGLAIAPRHRELRAHLARSDRRSRPPIQSFSRNHPINRFLGRLFHALQGRAQRQRAVS